MKRGESGKEGAWRGPPGEFFLELEKIALLRALEATGRHPEAEEIAWKVTARLLKRWLEGNPPRNPKAWIRIAIDSRVRDWRKSRRSRVSSLDQRREEGRDLGEGEDRRRRSGETQEWLDRARKRAFELFEGRLTDRQRRAFFARLVPEDPAARPDLQALAGVLGPRILDVPASTTAVLVPAGAGRGLHLRPLATNLQEPSGLGILSTRTLSEAARAAGLSVRDLKQARKELIRKGRKLLEEGDFFSPPPQ